MSTITRTWVAFAAIGVGLIHLALVIGAPPGLGIVLVVLGLTEFGWGVLTFARETVALPRVAIVVALVPVLAWALLLATSSAPTSLAFLPLAVSTAFELFAVAVLGRHLRRRQAADAPPPPPRVGRYLLGLVLGAAVVAVLTTTALGATGFGADLSAGDSPYWDLPGHGH